MRPLLSRMVPNIVVFSTLIGEKVLLRNQCRFFKQQMFPKKKGGVILNVSEVEKQTKPSLCQEAVGSQ